MDNTEELSNTKSHNAMVDALNNLLEKNYDSEKGYREALLETESDKLKTFFTNQASQRAQYINELDKEIRLLNATPSDSGSIKGNLHRAWMNLKSFMSSNTDEAILQECIHGDKTAATEYEDTLESYSFLDRTKKVIQYQVNGIKNTLDTIKELDDIVD